MQFPYIQIIKDAFRDYTKRFGVFFLIIYAFTAASELSRQVMLENFVRLQWEPDKFSYFHPLIFFPAAVAILLVFWGFASLYFCFIGMSAGQSVLNGLKNLHRYSLFVLLATFISFTAFMALPLIALTILRFFGIQMEIVTQDITMYLVALPPMLVLGVPGIYMAVSLSVAPFILVLEKRGLVASAWLSFQRVSRFSLKIASLLIGTFLGCGIIYILVLNGIFMAKLSLLADMSLRKESMLRVFIYSLPWVLVSIYFDLVVYHMYYFLKKDSEENGVKTVKQEEIAS